MAWPDNSVWEPREMWNRAPRPGITECERLHKRNWSTARTLVKIILLGGFLAVALVGLFYVAGP